MRVLVATRRLDLGGALALFLSERDIHVDVVDDADQALSLARSSRPDAVLVDWGLGQEASATMVSALMHRDDPTPVIILSSQQEWPRAGACGAAACATLGDHPDALLATLLEVQADTRFDATP